MRADAAAAARHADRTQMCEGSEGNIDPEIPGGGTFRSVNVATGGEVSDGVR